MNAFARNFEIIIAEIAIQAATIKYTDFSLTFPIFKFRAKLLRETAGQKRKTSSFERVEDVLSVGDEVTVKVYEIDSQGRINLTMKDLETRNNEEEKIEE